MDFLSYFEHIPYGIYICFMLLPFVQEDAAVIGAASAAVTSMGDPTLLFFAVIFGLTISDLWKYWAGRAALSYDWARKYAENPRVQQAKTKVINSLATSLMVVRFVPGTRVPFYVASGFFNAPFGKFSFFVIGSAVCYVSLVFVLFHALGAVLGEQIKTWLPLIAIGLVITLVGGHLIRSRLVRNSAG